MVLYFILELLVSLPSKLLALYLDSIEVMWGNNYLSYGVTIQINHDLRIVGII